MDSAESEQSIIALDAWLQTPAGTYVRAWEQACLDELTADIFGFNAVQIGLPQIDALAASRMPNKWQAATRLSSTAPSAASFATARSTASAACPRRASRSRICASERSRRASILSAAR